MEDLSLLLIEDSDDDARLILDELLRGSYAVDVTRVQTRPSLIYALSNRTFDLAICESRLQDLDALDAVTLTRELAPRLPIILAGSTITADEAAEMMRAGAADCIPKEQLARLTPAVRRELHHAHECAEAHRLRAALELTQRRLTTTITDAPIGICHVSPSGQWTMVNESMCVMLGYTREELLRRTLFDLTHPDDLAASAEALAGIVAGHEAVVHMEKRYVRRNGEVMWAEVTGSPVRNASGQLDYMIVIVDDLTRRKAAEDAVRQSERRFRLLIDTVHDGIWVVDARNRTVYANARFAGMLGYTSEELSQMCAAAISPGAASIAARVSVSDTIDSLTEDVHLRKSDGTELSAVVSGSALREENNRVAVLLTIMDITGRRRAERELIKRDIQLREAQQLALLGSWEFDLATKRREMSDNVSLILGLPASTLTTGFSQIVGATHPADRAALIAANRRALHDLAPVDLDFRVIRPDGETRFVYARAKVLPDEHGNAGKIIGIIQDITERRGAQLELQRRAQQQAAIAMLGQLALAGSGVELLLAELLPSLQEVMGAEFSEVLRTGPSGTFVRVSEKGWSHEDAPAVFDAARSHAAYVLETGLAVIIDDFATEQRFQVPPVITASGASSALLVPIAGGDEGAYGVLGVYSLNRSHFTAEDVNFLRACANVVAECLHRENVESALRDQARQQAAIADLAQRILVSPSLDETVGVADLVMATLDVEYASFLRLQPDGRQLVMLEGVRWLMKSGEQIPVEGTQAGFSVEHNETLIVDDYRTDSRFGSETNFLTHGILSGATVPVVGKKTRFGVLSAHSRSARRFPPADVRFIRAAADLLAEGLERAETERELRESRARYRDVVEGAPAIIATFSADRTILALNRAFEEITGWTVAEWVGRDFADLISTEDQQKARLFFGSIVKEMTVAPVDMKLRTRGGEDRVLQISAAPHSSGGQVVEIYLFAHDVTERRVAESERLRIGRDLELILDAAGEGIYGVGIDGRCTMMNRAAAAILGYSPEELLGGRIHQLIHKHPRAHKPCRIADAIRTGQRIRVSEDAFMARDGREIPVEYSASPIFDEGTVKGAVVCFADTSGRQKLEGQLEQARRLSSLGKLAATVAHEFNNVLMGISPFTDLMRRETEKTNQRLFDSTTHIQNALKRGKRITEEILRFTNPAQPALVVFDVAGWLRSIEHEIRSAMGEAFSVRVRTPSESLSAVGDPSQLHQILINLALNARDAMPAGGDLTLLARRPARGETFPFGILENPESYVQISIRDTGSGIPASVLPHVFEPLFTTKKSGTGLGLAVTHQVVQRHRGEIFVESAAGSGTTFHLFIPLGRQEDIPAEAPQREHPGLTTRTILLVEDDPIVAAGLEAALESEGLTVHRASTGQEAIDRLRSTRFDGAIIDVGLPDMEGTRVYELGVEHAAIPVIFSTGHADKSKIASYLAHPNVAYLLKPYSIDVLLETLVRILGV